MSEQNHSQDKVWQDIVANYSTDAACEPQSSRRRGRAGLVLGVGAAIAGASLVALGGCKSTHDVSSSQVTASAGGECVTLTNAKLSSGVLKNLLGSTSEQKQGWTALQEDLQKDAQSADGTIGGVDFKVTYASGEQSVALVDYERLQTAINTNTSENAGVRQAEVEPLSSAPQHGQEEPVVVSLASASYCGN